MISPGQAEDIVRNCIDEVVDTDEEYKANKPLGKFSILAEETVDDLKIEICENKKVGVLAFDHTLNFDELDDIDSDTLAGDIEDIIKEKAKPVQKKAKKKGVRL
jgi:hypothetical protein